ncbi:hypothetical protein HID58_047778 [Brassica napus]|uniref:Uncharacterized protein n=1 Tax=Brassica napus TaxID=3708 RepID=A0ABQ8B1R3_BRANA|nr:hypothetical protein HID58_047778 [Brassica napus]
MSSSNRRPGVRHSTFESLRLGRSSQSIASGFLHFWDSLNFKKDMEFVGITVLFLDEKMWLGKSVLSRALTSPKKQLESLSVSSLIRKKQSTHNSL